MARSFRSAVADARRHGDLYFAALLSQDRIEEACGRLHRDHARHGRNGCRAPSTLRCPTN